MRKLVVISLVIIGCNNNRQGKIVLKEPIDSFRRHMIVKVQGLRSINRWDSATRYLDNLYDTVRSLNHDRLTFYWLLEKIQQLNGAAQYDSASNHMRKALALLPAEGMNYKDSFNLYVIHLYLLKSQELLDSALQIANTAYYLARNDSFKVTTISLELAKMYAGMNDMPNMKKYIMKAWANKQKDSEYTNEIARLFFAYYDQMNNVDSALYYLEIIQNNPGRYSYHPVYVASLHELAGLFLVKRGRLQEGLKDLLKTKKIFDSVGMKNAAFFNNLADTYMQLNDLNIAFLYVDSAIQLSAAEKDYHVMSIAWDTKSELLFKEKQYQKAYAALDSSYAFYNIEMDSSLREKAREVEAKYAVREKDNQIRTLALTNHASLKIRKQQKVIIVTMIFAILFLTIIGFLLWRRKKTQMILRESNLKQQLLRAQMEPHFLFNSLSVLRSLIRSGDSEGAINYLTFLAKLIRFNFENARENLVLFQSEIEALKAYLDLQKMYKPGLFEYSISLYQNYQDEEIFIPPMLFQPLVENSILHGFSQITHQGKINIEIERLSDRLHCVIEDNGKGIQQTIAKKNIHSIEINQERLSILSKQMGIPAELKIIDKGSKDEDGGVRVEIEIPISFTQKNVM